MNRTTRTVSSLVSLVSLVFLVSPAVLAQETPRGGVVSRIVTGHDPEQQYSLYLPAAYDPEKTWPLLFVLDPRGRAEATLRLFAAAAEEHGWIVMSSYQSRSDTTANVTTTAFQALLKEAERFSVDTRRFYLAGMSGTSFASWRYAAAMDGHVAGVIGVGGGLPQELESPGKAVPFAYFGIAGSDDFNYQGQHRLDQQLAAIDAVHRLEIFTGRHGWPPDSRLPGAAVDWLELMAMKSGLAPRREAWIDAQLAARREAAAAPADAATIARRHDQVVRDFDGLRDIEELRQIAVALAEHPDVRAARSQEKKLARQEAEYRRFFWDWMARHRTGPFPGQTAGVLQLRLAPLKKQATGASGDLAAASARRRLESVFVQLAFYLPREEETAGRMRRAAGMLRLATAIYNTRAAPRWRLAALYAKTGQKDDAFKALAAAITLSKADVERLENDPQWQSLHSDPRWKELLYTLKLRQNP